MRFQPRLHAVAATVLVATLLSANSAAAQQSLRIGVVLPGQNSTNSANWNELLAARAWEAATAKGSTGVLVELYFRDGGTTPANTVDAIRELSEQEQVHAVVCCTTATSAAAASRFSQALPIIALARPNSPPAGEPGPLVMAAGPLAQARAMALHARAYGRGVGLMTLDNSFGREVADAVVAALVEAGLPLARMQTYPPGSQVLTPEALLVAASEPSSVIVWGLVADSAAALDGLRARGYDGPVYLPWQVAREFPGGVRSSQLRGSLVAAPPAVLGDALPPDHPNAAAVTRFRTALAQAYGVYASTSEGALAFDALELLSAGGELALVYGVDPGDLGRFRQALFDALVALGPLSGAAGTYDYDGRQPQLALARGLVIALAEASGLRPVDP